VRVTIKHIAEHLDLSVATVSRVLSKADDPFISDSTRARVSSKATELGYVPNRAARALVTGRTDIIELQLPPSDHFSSQISKAMIQILRRYDYDVIVHDLIFGTAGQSGIPNSRQLWPVDGIISMANGSVVESFLEFQAANLVSIGAYCSKNVDYVGLDLYPGTLDAIRHLVSAGCRRIAYLGDCSADLSQEARGIAYHQAMREAGLKCEYILANEGTKRGAQEAVCEYVQKNGHPDGIFCHNDTRALGAFRGLCDIGVRVPDDVKIIGCDGIEDTEYVYPSISTIVTPIEEMCELAWKFLQSRMENPGSPKQQATLYPSFVRRESC
jgi:DNA-binding LacI/PurR family transcriptional regulator